MSSYQFHQENSYTTLNISAVSHIYCRKIHKIDINKSSGSSELVHITVGMCMCTFLSAYTSSVWVDSISCKGKRWVLTMTPVQPGTPVSNGGPKGCMTHFLTQWLCCLYSLKVMGRAEERWGLQQRDHSSSTALSNSHPSRIHPRF